MAGNEEGRLHQSKPEMAEEVEDVCTGKRVNWNLFGGYNGKDFKKLTGDEELRLFPFNF